MGAARRRARRGALARAPCRRSGDRRCEQEGVRSLRRRRAGARGDRHRARGAAGDGRSHAPALRAADHLGEDGRRDARRGDRRVPPRRLGEGRRCRARGGGARRDRVRPLPSPRRRRPDGRDHQPVDAGVDSPQPQAGQPLVQQPERGPRQGAPLRRQQPGRARPAAVDGNACSARSSSAASPPAARSS